MPVNRDPHVAVILEWESGVKQEKKIHTVRLEIPPSQISLRMSKNVQKTVTTKGWVLNHGIDNLATISASGTAYQPRIREHALEEGFNPDIGIAGLEFLQAAYIASGRLSSNPDLTATVSSDLYKQTLEQQQVTTKDGMLQTISQRVSILNKIRNKIIGLGLRTVSGFTTTVSNTSAVSEVVPNFLEQNTTTQTDIDQIRASISAGVYGLDVSDGEKALAYNLLNVLRVDNAEIIFRNFSELSIEQPRFVPLVDKLEFLLSRAKNQNLGISIPGLDPSVSTLLQRDPFAILKANAAQKINKNLKIQAAADPLLRGLVATQPEADDWVITVYMYWQDMVFSGHFESLDINQSAQVIGLWNWSFTYVVHDGWLLKNNNIVPFTKAFDPHITNIESPGSSPDSYRNVNRPLDALLVKERGGGRPSAIEGELA